jgi:hypothetical protein
MSRTFALPFPPNKTSPAVDRHQSDGCRAARAVGDSEQAYCFNQYDGARDPIWVTSRPDLASPFGLLRSLGAAVNLAGQN